MPLALPHSLVLKIKPETIRVRHTICNDAIFHPADIAWMLDEIGSHCQHALYLEADGLRLERGLPPNKTGPTCRLRGSFEPEPAGSAPD